MKVDKLRRLFDALDTSAQKSRNSKIAQFPKPLQPEDGEAVKVSQGLSTGGERAEKVAQIKAQVESNSYQVDSRETARALVRDLF